MVANDALMFYKDSPHKGEKSYQSPYKLCFRLTNFILILEELQFRMVIFKSKPNRDKTQSHSLKKATQLL